MKKENTEQTDISGFAQEFLELMDTGSACKTEESCDVLKSLVKDVDEDVILQCKELNSHSKIYALSLKYDRDIRDDLLFDPESGSLLFNGTKIFNVADNKYILKIDIMRINGKENLSMEGRVSLPLSSEMFEIFLCTDSERHLLELQEGRSSIEQPSDYAPDGTRILNRYTFDIKISLADTKRISFEFQFKKNEIVPLMIEPGKYAKLGVPGHSFYVSDGFVLKLFKTSISVYPKSRARILRYRVNNVISLLKKAEFGALCYRAAYFICRPFHKKEIWLITDREYKADDNAEHMFRFIMEQKNDNIKPYFLIDKKSEDYERMCKTGPVIPAASFKHRLYCLLASVIISSQANEYVVNPFGRREKYYKDIKDFKFVFLQHGITKDDQSKWLKKFNRNISILVTAARPEYESMLNPNYYYTEKEVKLTGFPRHDRLLALNEENKKTEKKILLLPTWRKNLAGEYNAVTGERAYAPAFKESEYFKFYDSLINDERVLSVLKDTGYHMKLCMHPEQVKQYVDFHGNEYVFVNDGFANYQYEFTTSDLMVTDYSSVFFDMAYLRKPIIYAHFDEASFYEGHTYDKGYFDYERDGFGPVCHNYEETVAALVDAIESDCKAKPEYLERIDGFYAYHDKNNCRRVYEEILKL